jgi:hypothetical protein
MDDLKMQMGELNKVLFRGIIYKVGNITVNGGPYSKNET